MISMQSLPHVFAGLWFVLLWIGYNQYALRKGARTPCLASVLHQYRVDWMRRMLGRENRIADANVIGNLERNASFFASSTLIILAGILTVLGSSENAIATLAELPFVQHVSRELYELKLIGMAIIFVYAFFTFSWCMRQYNFAAVLVGAAPMVSESDLAADLRQAYAERTARVLSLAANQFNQGLRAYYYGLATLAWLINPWLFILATTGVVLVLYRREFHSDALDVMVGALDPVGNESA